MARNYAQFTTAIWRPDDDFGRLTRNAQWLYFMLATQPDISAAGVLSMNIRRWSGRCADGGKQDVIDGLKELATHRFIAYDYETEEVLIRTFIKSDGGYSNRKRKPVIERAVRDVESQALRKVLADELGKVGLPTEWASDALSDAHCMAYPLDGDEPPEESDNSASSQVDSPSDRASDGSYQFDGVVVTQAVVVVPQPSTRIPQPVPPPAAPADAAAEQAELPGMPLVEQEPTGETDEQRAWRLARAWLDECPNRNIPVVKRGKGDLAMKLKNLLVGYLAAKFAEDDINDALRRCDKAIPTGDGLDGALKAIQRARDLTQQDRGAGELERRSGPVIRSPADQRVADGQALYEKYRREQENARG